VRRRLRWSGGPSADDLGCLRQSAPEAGGRWTWMGCSALLLVCFPLGGLGFGGGPGQGYHRSWRWLTTRVVWQFWVCPRVGLWLRRLDCGRLVVKAGVGLEGNVDVRDTARCQWSAGCRQAARAAGSLRHCSTSNPFGRWRCLRRADLF
jgi:hypothetical protein